MNNKEKKEMGFISLNKIFTKEVKTKNDKLVTIFTLPENTIVNNINVGGFTFFNNLNKVDKFNTNNIVTMLNTNENIVLRDYVKNANGDYETVEIETKCSDLIEAVKLQQKEYAQENKRDLVYLTLNNCFVTSRINSKTNKPFNIATLPKNTIINGKDLGGYSFNPLIVKDNKNICNAKVLPLVKDSEVWLTKSIKNAAGEYEKNIEKVSPQAIQEALSLAREQWIAEHNIDNENSVDNDKSYEIMKDDNEKLNFSEFSGAEEEVSDEEMEREEPDVGIEI